MRLDEAPGVGPVLATAVVATDQQTMSKGQTDGPGK